MKKLFLLLFGLVFSFHFSQIGIGNETSNPAAILDIKSSKKGFLIPRMSETARNTLQPKAVEGLTIYNLNSHCIEYWNGNAWKDFECTRIFTLNNCNSLATVTANSGETVTAKRVITYTSNYAFTLTDGTKLNTVSIAGLDVYVDGTQNLAAGSGNINVIVRSATTATTGSGDLNFSIEGFTCKVPVNITPSNLFTLTCPTGTSFSTTIATSIADNTQVIIPYTSNYAVGSVTAGNNIIDGATEYNGIKVTIANSATIDSGNGTITLNITGTPTVLGDNIIPIKILGQTCSIIVNVIDLVLADLPNAYIIKLGTVFTFPVTKPYLVWANEAKLQSAAPWNLQPIQALETAKLLWSENSTSTQAPIITFNGSGKYATITVDARNVTQEVNGLVAYYDGANDGVSTQYIRWSYHLWITNYNPDTNTAGTTYNYDSNTLQPNPNKIIMDRNLGALGGIYTGSTTKDAQGLLYQWGKKDPLPYVLNNNKIPGGLCSGATCTYVPAITNFGASTTVSALTASPTQVVYTNIAKSITQVASNGKFPVYIYPSSQAFDWTYVANYPNGANPNPTANQLAVNDLWTKPGSPSTPGKGYYDPCPTGWRVPDDINVFSKISISSGSMQMNPGSAINTSLGYFPMSGSTSSSNAGITDEGAGGWGVYWTGNSGSIIGNLSNANIGAVTLEFKLQGSPTYLYKSTTVKPRSYLGSVRCIKDF